MWVEDALLYMVYLLAIFLRTALLYPCRERRLPPTLVTFLDFHLLIVGGAAILEAMLVGCRADDVDEVFSAG